jgi:hypothetical protein
VGRGTGTKKVAGMLRLEKQQLVIEKFGSTPLPEPCVEVYGINEISWEQETSVTMARNWPCA